MDSKKVKFDLHQIIYDGQIDLITKHTSIENSLDERDHHGCTLLHIACARNHTLIADHLIRLGADVNCHDSNMSTPLHWAVYNGNIELVRTLINRGAKIHVKDFNGIEPFHLAALKGHIDIVKYFKPTRLWVTIGDENKTTPLHLAAYCGHTDVVQMFLNTGPADQCKQNLHLRVDLRVDVNAQDVNNIRPLELAVASNHHDVIRLLVESGATVTDAILHLAVVHCRVETIQLLYDKHEHNRWDRCEWIPLYLATTYGHDETVKYVLKNHLKALHVDKGYTEMYPMLTNLDGPDGVLNKYYDELATRYATLNWAAAFCSARIVERLLNDGARIESTDIINRNAPLHAAACFGNKEVVELLINRGAEINKLNADKQTPLYWAICYSHIEIVQYLLDNGSAKDEALHWAAACGNLHIVKLLIENGCEFKESIFLYPTYQWDAAGNNHADIVEYLLDNQPIIKDHDLLHWCTLNGSLAGVRMVIERGVNVNTLDFHFKRTALHWAAIAGHTDIAQYLLSVDGIRVNEVVQEKIDTTPICYAITGNHYDIIQLLLEHGGQVDCKDRHIQGPLYNAINGGDLKTVQILINYDQNFNKEYYGDFPLNKAVQHNHMDIVDYLLFEKDVRKNMAFVHRLAEYSSTSDLMKYIQPEDVHALNSDQETPLYCAVRGDKPSNVEFLLKHGSDVNHNTSHANSTPLHLAISNQRLKCAYILLENGADVNIMIPSGWDQMVTPVIHAINKDDVKLLRLLTKYDVDMTGSLLHACDVNRFELQNFEIIKAIIAKDPTQVIEPDIHPPIPYICQATEDDADDRSSITIMRYKMLHFLLRNGIKACLHTLASAICLKKYRFVKLIIMYGAPVKQLQTKTLCNCFTRNQDIKFVKLLRDAGYDFNKLSLSTARDSELTALVQNIKSNPLRLKQLCRITCLNACGAKYVEYIQSQSLPYTLEVYSFFGEEVKEEEEEDIVDYF